MIIDQSFIYIVDQEAGGGCCTVAVDNMLDPGLGGAVSSSKEY